MNRNIERTAPNYSGSGRCWPSDLVRSEEPQRKLLPEQHLRTPGRLQDPAAQVAAVQVTGRARPVPQRLPRLVQVTDGAGVPAHLGPEPLPAHPEDDFANLPADDEDRSTANTLGDLIKEKLAGKLPLK